MVDILLIEDDDLLREHLCDGLSQLNHAVRQAASGEQGLAMFFERTADIVITDLVMDHGEGIGTILKLRETSPFTPIIAISGNPRYLEHSTKLGAQEGLLKPFRMTCLSDAIKNLTQNNPG